jgi:hypothetical protein
MRILCVIFVLGLGMAVAQSYVPGQPVIATENGTVSDGVSWDARQYSGADMCARIFNAWSAAMATGLRSATIDARGFTGRQTCTSSPFPAKATGQLLLGNAVIVTTVTWQVPGLVHVEGIGTTKLNPLGKSEANTVLLAGSTSADPVLQLGLNVGTSFDAQVKSMTIDANGLVTTGVRNVSAFEGSFLEDVNIYNATLYGLLLGQQSAEQNATGSGPYRNINVQFNKHCSTCGTGTTGILLLANTSGLSMPIRGIDNVTVTGYGTTDHSIGSCIKIVGMGVLITNSHTEFCQTGVQIGDPSGLRTVNVELENMNISNFTSGWDITITNAQDVSITGIEANGTNLLLDNVTGNKILGKGKGKNKGQNPIGFYLLGDGPHPAVMSSAASVTWTVPGNLHVEGRVTQGH